MKKNYLLTPGPTPLPPQVREALSKPIIHHRTPQYRAILKEVFEGLQYVFQTKNDVFIFSSSGTGAMEAAVTNLLSPGDTAITVQGGKFGERWTDICKAYNINAIPVDVEWGKAVTPKQIEDALKVNSQAKAVFTTLCETSTGVITDIKAIGEIVKNSAAVLVVDAISGLGAVDLQTDNWSVDVVVVGSQKGLMLPPGLAFISLSQKAWKLIESCKSAKYYFDLKLAKKAYDKTDTAFTSSVSLVVALCESLRLIKQEGLANCFNRYKKMADATRTALKALGLKLFADESCASYAITAASLPEGIDGEKLVKTMRDEYRVGIAGGQAQLKGKIIRIAHMGYINESDIIAAISCLEEVLDKFGYSFKKQAGIKAAKEVLSNS
ncbi:MAG: alanine--glyoxylate aminotransferase family protein [Candidatus Omnitrophica bacterium]|nr:alanine--glyoxylate aminotransferase family protein [Candidatus Omnitrophota bacterium]